MKRILLALLVVFTAGPSCQDGNSDSVVLVSVKVQSDLSGVTQLQTTITLGGLTTSENFPKPIPVRR